MWLGLRKKSDSAKTTTQEEYLRIYIAFFVCQTGKKMPWYEKKGGNNFPIINKLKCLAFVIEFRRTNTDQNFHLIFPLVSSVASRWAQCHL